ncbi:MAG TPA: PDZ domain-containing protein [Polyangia bacterium]|nr:PDZ domain-containing protein [Polyangia bacterium]
MRAWSTLLLAPVLFGGGSALASPRGHVKGMQIWLGGGARLGVELSGMSEDLRTFFGAPADRGVLVNRVEPDGPGARAGLKAGDVIVEVGGEKAEEPEDVVAVLADKKAGDTVSLGVVRNRARQMLSATLKAGKGKDGMDFFLSPGEGLQGLRWLAGGNLQKELEQTRSQLRELEKRLERLEKGR